MQRQQLDAAPQHGGDGRDGLGLVLLDADGGALRLQDLQDDAQAADDALGRFAHQAVVGRDVGLALRAVDDDGVDLAEAGGELDGRGKARAAHAGDAGLADDGDEVLGAHGGDGLGVPRLDRGAERVAAVGLDDDGRLQVPARMGPGLDGRDRAGHGGVDGDAEALAVADLLADGHTVSDFDERLAGRADVLRHRDGDDARVQRDDGRLTRKLLIALRMDAAEKGSFQGCTTSVHEVLGSGGRSKARRKDSVLRRPVKKSLRIFRCFQDRKLNFCSMLLQFCRCGG